jgi:hypothetical protein
MVIADAQSNLGLSGVMILWMVNHGNGLDLLAYRLLGLSLRRFLSRAGRF